MLQGTQESYVVSIRRHACNTESVALQWCCLQVDQEGVPAPELAVSPGQEQERPDGVRELHADLERLQGADGRGPQLLITYSSRDKKQSID